MDNSPQEDRTLAQVEMRLRGPKVDIFDSKPARRLKLDLSLKHVSLDQS